MITRAAARRCHRCRRVGAGRGGLRHGPRLSPDSITYLSAAEHLRHGRGLTDFTGEPFTVFPPVLPVVLAPFGAQLWWACAVTLVALPFAIAVLLHRLLVPRVRPGVADVAVLAVVVCQGTVTVVGSMFSEPLYVVVSLAAVLALGDGLLGDGSPSVRHALAVGALADSVPRPLRRCHADRCGAVRRVWRSGGSSVPAPVGPGCR